MSEPWPGDTELQTALRDDALQKDSQARGLRAAAVCRPGHAAADSHGEVRQACTAPERTDFILAGGGSLHRLHDLRDTAGVAAAQIRGSEEMDVQLTVVGMPAMKCHEWKTVMRTQSCCECVGNPW